jgi:hypothetical protein
MIDFYFVDFTRVVLFYFAELAQVGLAFVLPLFPMDAQIAAALRLW